MCSVFGVIIPSLANNHQRYDHRQKIDHLMQSSMERGRDGWGWQMTYRQGAQRHTVISRTPTKMNAYEHPFDFLPENVRLLDVIIIGNFRAEPTTEFVQFKSEADQQPYKDGNWTVVHNGTIANDHDLRTYDVRTSIDSAAIPELLNLTEQAMKNFTPNKLLSKFKSAIEKLVGSYAILATHGGYGQGFAVATNYRPLWYNTDEYMNTYIGSSEEYIPATYAKALEPYSVAMFDEMGIRDLERIGPYKDTDRKRALVVASGGLDSTVAASKCIADGMEVELIHFQYGCRAEGKEVDAISSIAERLGVPFKLFPLGIYDEKDSHLFNKDSKIAGGESGAEFAHEWVPARNLVMLSIAVSYAEANGFDYIVLGNNLEEAGAYPDNEPEFIRRMNKVLPFAVGDGKRVEIIMPVGNLMKHEIVAMGLQVGAPMDLTWSCYKNGEKHCGKCGPCFMRKTAFNINNAKEVIEYEGFKRV